MNMINYLIHNNRVTIVLCFLILSFGIVSYFNLGRLEDPEFTIKEAVITTYYPGATAIQVESEVTDKIEQYVQQLKQLKEVRSISRAGVSMVFAEIKENYNSKTLPQVWDELRRKMKEVRSELPTEAMEPHVNDDFGDVYGVLLAITGDGYSLREIKSYAKDLKRELLIATDVGKIDLWGAQTDIIKIEIDKNKVAKSGIALQSIIDTINRRHLVHNTGTVKMGDQEVHLRVKGDFHNLADLREQLIFDNQEGRYVRLKDVANIKRGYAEPSSAMLFWNGEPAIGMGISTVTGGNVIAMGDSIKEHIQKLRYQTPLGINVHYIADQAKTVKEASNGFVLNLLVAVLIVAFILICFMGLREGMIISTVLIITIMATLIGMHILHISLQRISLGALIISLGMLVDNAIVVSEGIVLKIKSGIGKIEASMSTVKESQWPLLGATIIAILAFAAITLSKDMTGEWLQSLFQVICLSLLLSWIFAVTLTPFLCIRFLPVSNSNELMQKNSKAMEYFRKILVLCIKYRKVTLGGVSLILILSFVAFSYVKQDFMPDMNRSQMTLDMWMPEGTHISETKNELLSIQEYVQKQKGVTDVSAFIGQGPLRFLLTYEPQMPNSAYGQLIINLKNSSYIESLKENLSIYLNKEHPNAVTSVDAFKLGPGGGAVVSRVIGTDPYVLMSIAKQIKQVVEQQHNTRSTRTDWGAPVKIQTLKLSQDKAESLGISRADISQSLEMNFSGATVGYYREKDERLPIVLQPIQEQRKNLDNLKDAVIWGAQSKSWLPLEQAIDGKEISWEYPVIQRINRHRVIRVITKPQKGTTDALFHSLKPVIEQIALPENYTLEWGGEHEEQVEANSKLMSNVPIAFAAMFFITVMLFDSLKHPLIIFLGLPLAIIGVANGMLIADQAFGFMAMLGFLSLFGMLIKNEIVLLDQINIEKQNGKSPYHAVLDATINRVRPVCMAAITTVLGMLPLLWDEFFAPMAVTIMGGLTFATVLTLIVIPVLYCLIFNVQVISHRTYELSYS